jgi:excinuclease ABC subunit A
MTVDEAADFFSAVPVIREKMVTLKRVGLGYIHVGQQATTLSGGEAQRVKLAKELSRRATGQTLYILDEPTTGLHFEDVRKLLEVLHALVDQGNTVLVIEHNLDVVKTADWIIDLGPEGGDKGGHIVAVGTPETVAKTKGSYTGEYLANIFKRAKRARPPVVYPLDHADTKAPTKQLRKPSGKKNAVPKESAAKREPKKKATTKKTVLERAAATRLTPIKRKHSKA